MVKGFTNKEKEIIRDKLIEKGKELFGIYGLKKTSIVDLTKAVGIAQGTFYLFFSSKEELYFEIFEIEETRIKDKIISEFFGCGEITVDILKKALRQGVRMFETSPIIRQIYMEDDYNIIFRKVPQERKEQHFQKDSDYILQLIKHWQEKGFIIEREPETIAALMRSLFAIPLHREVVGEEVYEDTMDLLTELIAQGLIKANV
ncbi:MAG: TetR/AcrR family transcriptional regulator [Clostridia bacterium]|nr:TetR/AcrR family transcriptional regulator [Clostridia bacterium]